MISLVPLIVARQRSTCKTSPRGPAADRPRLGRRPGSAAGACPGCCIAWADPAGSSGARPRPRAGPAAWRSSISTRRSPLSGPTPDRPPPQAAPGAAGDARPGGRRRAGDRRPAPRLHHGLGRRLAAHGRGRRPPGAGPRRPLLRRQPGQVRRPAPGDRGQDRAEVVQPGDQRRDDALGLLPAPPGPGGGGEAPGDRGRLLRPDAGRPARRPRSGPTPTWPPSATAWTWPGPRATRASSPRSMLGKLLPSYKCRFEIRASILAAFRGRRASPWPAQSVDLGDLEDAGRGPADAGGPGPAARRDPWSRRWPRPAGRATR